MDLSLECESSDENLSGSIKKKRRGRNLGEFSPSIDVFLLPLLLHPKDQDTFLENIGRSINFYQFLPISIIIEIM